MRKSTLVGGLAVALASMVLVLPPPATAAPGGGGGGTGEVYSDLLVALRDVDGVPILSKTFWEGVAPDAVPVTCIQPISYDLTLGTPQATNPADGRTVSLIPLVGQGSTELTPVPEDTACDPQAGFAAEEVDLERLNLVRTSDEVLWSKLSEVGARLATADDISLDGAGRITTWFNDPITGDPVGTAIDASPDQAAIYAATEGDSPAPLPPADGRPVTGEPGGLMDTGTIPYRYWTEDVPPKLALEYPLGDPAKILQGTGGFDQRMLAAAAIGTATGKSVPVTVDTIEYYNRTAAKDGDVSNWGDVTTLPSVANVDGWFAGDPPPEEFVDYRGFSYKRWEVFSGCTTWLDVGTLTWKWGTVMNRVEFIDIVAGASTSEVTNVAGFAQMADDVRSVINYLHNNEVVVNPDTGEGFFIDPVFEESCIEQAAMVDRLNEDADLARLMVTITSAPEDGTTDTSATFEFEPVIGSIWIGPDVDFVCELDGSVADPCTSPMTYSDLAVGEHTFTVYATAGGTAGLLTVYTWTVVAPDLTVTITEKPAALTYDTSAAFEFEAVEPDVDFVCELDGSVVDPCTSPMTYPDLAVGEHAFTVYATDGVTVGPAAIYEWEVLEPDLMVTITSAPADGTSVTSAMFEFEALDPDADFVCELDELVVDPCESGDTYLTPVGDHIFTVYATDGVTDGLPETYTWTVLPLGGTPGGTPGGDPTVDDPIVDEPTVPGDGDGDGDTMIVSLTPQRIADSRAGTSTADGQFVGFGPVAAGEVVEVQIAGRGGVPVGAEAVVANVTLVGAAAPGFATVFPCGTVPDTSSVNYLAVTNEAVANEVIAKLSPTGSICVFTSAAANVLVDVSGFVPASSDFVSLTPVRLGDTRPTSVAAGQFVEVQIAGRGGVPADAKAVVANVTLVGAAAPGFATVFPCGTVPDASSVNYLAVTNEAVANEVIAKLSPTGSICVFTSAAANVLVDVSGYL